MRAKTKGIEKTALGDRGTEGPEGRLWVQNSPRVTQGAAARAGEADADVKRNGDLELPFTRLGKHSRSQ